MFAQLVKGLIDVELMTLGQLCLCRAPLFHRTEGNLRGFSGSLRGRFYDFRDSCRSHHPDSSTTTAPAPIHHRQLGSSRRRGMKRYTNPFIPGHECRSVRAHNIKHWSNPHLLSQKFFLPKRIWNKCSHLMRSWELWCYKKIWNTPIPNLTDTDTDKI